MPYRILTKAGNHPVPAARCTEACTCLEPDGGHDIAVLRAAGQKRAAKDGRFDHVIHGLLPRITLRAIAALAHIKAIIFAAAGVIARVAVETRAVAPRRGAVARGMAPAGVAPLGHAALGTPAVAAALRGPPLKIAAYSLRCPFIRFCACIEVPYVGIKFSQ